METSADMIINLVQISRAMEGFVGIGRDEVPEIRL